MRVRVLVDAIGSVMLSNHFWDPLRQAGGEIRVFNVIGLRRVTIRNHRKLLVCDERVAVIGGFNISPAYEGDGVKSGWCDVGLRIEDPPLAKQLASSFDEMFERADFRHKRFMRWRKFGAKKSVTLPAEQFLFSGPGRGRSPFKQSLRQDLAQARDVRIVVAYFLPTWRLRRALMRVARQRRAGAIDPGGQIRRAAGPVRGTESVPAAAAQLGWRFMNTSRKSSMRSSSSWTTSFIPAPAILMCAASASITS